MKRLAATFAFLWWAQALICLIPGLAHAHDGSPAQHAAHTAHGHHHASPAEAERAPTSDHDPGCEQHCASLAQALPLLAPAAAPPTFAFLLPLAATAAPLASARFAARAVGEQHQLPPPDFVLEHASLLI